MTLLDRLRAPGTVLLDAPRADADTRRAGAVLYAGPVDTLVAHRVADVSGVLDRLDAALADGFHVAGMLAYEAGDAFVGGAGPQSRDVAGDAPLAWFGVYRAPEPIIGLNDALAGLPPPCVAEPAFAWSEGEYAARVDAVRALIHAGDVYQVNLTMPVRFGLGGEALALYAALRARQPVSYGAWLSLPDGTAVASVSPELFVRVDATDGGRIATARPMKGTAPRGATHAADDRLARDLLASEKDRAENLMIVDLLRNDLARVAEAGSVHVPALFEAERYDTLIQMTSTVTARLRADATVGRVLAATFPCGSVTGAPKARAMQRIREIEGTPRGVYCGAIGHAAPDGTAAFSVAIRTAVVRGRAGVYGVGSGIVWDSRADAEWAECHLKARVLTGLAS